MCSLTSFRWIVPANGEITLRVWFYRDSPGKFEQTFNFELLGTRRNYQLQCTGICSYPSVCTDYMLVRTACLHSMSLPCDAGARKADGGLEVTFYLRSSPSWTSLQSMMFQVIMVTPVDWLYIKCQRMLLTKGENGEKKGSPTLICSCLIALLSPRLTGLLQLMSTMYWFYFYAVFSFWKRAS